MRCLIVDDEAPARLELRRLLAAHGEIEIAGEAADIATALDLNRQHQPDVVFLDIKLRGETGFDFVGQVPEPAPHIVFVTAFDRYAVRGFECNALDYLLKPVRPERLAETLRRFHQRQPAPPQAESDDAVFLRIGASARFIPWQQIHHIVSEGNYTRVFLKKRAAPSSSARSRNGPRWLPRVSSFRSTALRSSDAPPSTKSAPMARAAAPFSSRAGASSPSDAATGRPSVRSWISPNPVVHPSF